MLVEHLWKLRSEVVGAAFQRWQEWVDSSGADSYELVKMHY